MPRQWLPAILTTLLSASPALGQTTGTGPSPEACGPQARFYRDSLGLMLVLRPQLRVQPAALDRTSRQAQALAEAFVAPRRLSFREAPLATRMMAESWSDAAAMGTGLGATLDVVTDSVGHLVTAEIGDSAGAPELNEALLAAAYRADSLGMLAATVPGDTTPAHIMLTAVLELGRPPTAVMRLRVPEILATGDVSIKHAPAAQYPEVARKIGLPGVVSMQWVVDERGKPIPKSIIILHADFKEFLAAAVHVVLGATYNPSHWGTCPIKELVQQTVSFRIR
jgi:outer membrane biosynthesis protein TonB